jgi:hypothetical protein
VDDSDISIRNHRLKKRKGSHRAFCSLPFWNISTLIDAASHDASAVRARSNRSIWLGLRSAWQNDRLRPAGMREISARLIGDRGADTATAREKLSASEPIRAPKPLLARNIW